MNLFKGKPERAFLENFVSLYKENTLKGKKRSFKIPNITHFPKTIGSYR